MVPTVPVVPVNPPAAAQPSLTSQIFVPSQTAGISNHSAYPSSTINITSPPINPINTPHAPSPLGSASQTYLQAMQTQQQPVFIAPTTAQNATTVRANVNVTTPTINNMPAAHPNNTNAPSPHTPLTGQINIVTQPPPPQPVKEPFAIKVMRLPSPSFNNAVVLPLDFDLSASTSSAQHHMPSLHMDSSESLVLPTDIGMVYLGENFRAGVCILQQSGIPLKNVTVRLELQTSNKRWGLLDTTSAQSTTEEVMQPSTTKEYIVQHNLAELGVNCLVCCVLFTDAAGARRTFQKFFKFSVLDPFSIHTTIHTRLHAPSIPISQSKMNEIYGRPSNEKTESKEEQNSSLNSSYILVEVSLTSLMARHVCIENIKFEPTHPDLFHIQEYTDHSTIDGVLSGTQPEVTDLKCIYDNEEDQSELDIISSVSVAKPADSTASTSNPAPSTSSLQRRKYTPTATDQCTHRIFMSAPIQGSTPASQHSATNSTSHSFLFKLHEINPSRSKYISDLGRIQIKWRSNIGEVGRIKSSLVQRSIKNPTPIPLSLLLSPSSSLGSSAIEVTILKCPATVVLEQPFKLQSLLVNRTAVWLAVSIQWNKDKMNTILPMGTASRTLGLLGPSCSISFSSTLLSVGLGVQRVGGLRVIYTPMHVPLSRNEDGSTRYIIQDAVSMGHTVTMEHDNLHQIECIHPKYES